MKTKKTIFNMKIALILILVLFISGCTQNTRIIDGDTIEVNERTIRLLGINAPESDQPFYLESKEKMRSLIENKQIKLESDKLDKDSYGRYLRYAFTDIFVNREMIRSGYAWHFTLGQDLKHDFSEDQEYAMGNRLGIWKDDFFCIRIEKVDVIREFAVIKNICPLEVDLYDWYIRDETGHRYYFKTVISDKLILHSLKGEHSENELYWNSEYPIWNNNGDRATIIDSKGRKIDEISV